MARASNQVRRAREARLQNMGLTCDASLARNLPSSEPSRLRDRPRSQVEAVVLQVPASRSSEPWTARTIFLHQLSCLLSDFLALIRSIHFRLIRTYICFPISIYSNLFLNTINLLVLLFFSCSIFFLLFHFLNFRLFIDPASMRCYFPNLSSIDLPSAKAC